MRAVIGFVVIIILSVFSAQAQDCDCGKPAFVLYELSGDGLELDENPWRVAVITHFDVDLTQTSEPELCEVKLDLIPAVDPILYKNFETVPKGDFELNFEGQWMLASQFETKMIESHCLSDQASS